MGIVSLYPSVDRILCSRICVKRDQVFSYTDVTNPKRELFVHKLTWDGVMVSRHLQTGDLYFTIHPFTNVLVIGEVNPDTEPLFRLPMPEERSKVYDDKYR